MRKFFKVALESEAGALELTAEQAAVAAQAVAAAQPQTVSVTIELNPQQQAEVTAQAADAAQAAAAVAEAPVAEAPAAELPAEVATGEGPTAIEFDGSGRFAYVANVSSDSVTVLSIDTLTGVMSRVGTDVAGANGPAAIVFVNALELDR